MPLGRETECARIDALLEGARQGKGGTLVLRGEAGVGKSTLLEYARQEADGMTVLSARSVETEAELALAGLSQALWPILDLSEALPAPQRAALEAGLGRGPPLAPGDRFAVYAAVLSLLVAASEHSPVLLLADDAHWLDRSSAEALTFSARRLGEEGVALIFARREPHPGAFDPNDLPEMHLDGLDPAAAVQLLRQHVSADVSATMAEHLVDATGGNPLALIELPDVLTEAQLAGREALAEPLPVGPQIEGGFQRRIAGLSPCSQRALAVAAASGSNTTDELVPALRELGMSLGDLEPAEMAGLVAVNGSSLTFPHPLARSAAYQASSSQERRAAHRALADALASTQLIGRRALHLAAAAVEPDEEVAAELEQAGVDARGRGASDAATSALRAAARLTPDPEQRARRLRDAAADAYLAGSLREAGDLLAEGLELSEEPLLRADMQHTRGRVEMLIGSPWLSRDMLVAGADAVEASSPAKAALMLSDAAWACMMAAEGEPAVSLGRRAHSIAETVGAEVELTCGFVLGNALVMLGDREAGYPLMVRAEPLIDSAAPSEAIHLGTWFGHCCCIAGDEARGARMLRRVVVQARAQSALGALPLALGFLCNAEFRLGNWAAAYAAGMESIRLAEDTGQTNELTSSLVWLAQVEAVRGNEEPCRAHAARALELVDVTGAESMRHLGRAALGLLELGLGRPDETIEQLEFVERFGSGRSLGEPAVAQAAPNLIEAYLNAGRPDDAAEALAVLDERAERTGGLWARAAAARCHGMLADDDEFEDHFDSALELHGRHGSPFERGRTELALGERLRRARRRADARPWLRRALDTFEHLGATPWEEKARRHLAATGERSRRRRDPGSDTLTAQELLVALLVAEGATNREAAASLFVSPKTVETHLGSCYRKLGIRSRTALAKRLEEEGVAADRAEVTA
jgi:DNA-binding CsgD family transcriptional regulator